MADYTIPGTCGMCPALQDLVQLHAEELGPLLTHPQCHLYVAGSSKMSEGVSRALQALIGTSSFTRIVEDGR